MSVASKYKSIFRQLRQGTLNVNDADTTDLATRNAVATFLNRTLVTDLFAEQTSQEILKEWKENGYNIVFRLPSLRRVRNNNSVKLPK